MGRLPPAKRHECSQSATRLDDTAPSLMIVYRAAVTFQLSSATLNSPASVQQHAEEPLSRSHGIGPRSESSTRLVSGASA